VKSEEFAAAIPSPAGTPEGNSSLFAFHFSLRKAKRRAYGSAVLRVLRYVVADVVELL
jgi:hypothetical protein